MVDEVDLGGGLFVNHHNVVCSALGQFLVVVCSVYVWAEILDSVVTWLCNDSYIDVSINTNTNYLQVGYTYYFTNIYRRKYSYEQLLKYINSRRFQQQTQQIIVVFET